MEEEKTLKEKLMIYACIIASIILIVSVLIYFNYSKKLDFYNKALIAIQQENWAEAKSNLQQITNFKDANILLETTNDNYYLEKGNSAFKNKEYHMALELYSEIKNQDFKKQKLNNRINELEKIIKKLDEEEQKRQALLLKKQEEENLRRQKEAEAKARAEAEKRARQIREAQRAKERELNRLEYLIENAFTNISIYDDGTEYSGTYEFYIRPENWFSLTYQEKQNVLATCRKYIVLKEEVSEHRALRGVRIKDAYTGTELGSALMIK